jgi:molecular chaperone HscB
MGDAFELFGVDPAFDLDLTVLERRHRELSRALHPDRYAGRPPAERRAALSKAMEVNDAWRTLRDSVRRAEALLGRLGIPLGQRREPPTDPELLMEVMELRERLAEAHATRDQAALHELAAGVHQRQARAEARMAGDFASALLGATPGAAPPQALAQKLLSELGELRYYRKLLDDVGVIQDQLF